jgi:hypothetical protein
MSLVPVLLTVTASKTDGLEASHNGLRHVGKIKIFMKKERDWVDYAGLASSVGQNIQLSKINSELQRANALNLKAIEQQTNQAIKQELRREYESGLQNVLWNLMQLLERSKKEYANDPRKFTFALLGLTPRFSATAFEDWENKQRLKSFCDELDGLKEQMRAAIGEAEFEDAVKYRKALDELKDLNRYILMGRLELEFNQKSEQLNKELAELEAQHKAEPVKLFSLSSWKRASASVEKVKAKQAEINSHNEDGQFAAMGDSLSPAEIIKGMSVFGLEIAESYERNLEKMQTMENESAAYKAQVMVVDKSARKVALEGQQNKLKEQFERTYEEAVKYRLELLEAVMRSSKLSSIEEAEQQILGETKSQ